MEIRFLKNEEIKEVVKLSKMFEEENCCNGIVADNEKFFEGKKVLGCLNDGKLIAYCYGSLEHENKKRSYSEIGDLFFELEEIYVLPEFRNLKIGQRLFKFAEGYAKGIGCKTMRLNAVNKDYKRLLNFYIDILGMEFISAYLIKNI